MLYGIWYKGKRKEERGKRKEERGKRKGEKRKVKSKIYNLEHKTYNSNVFVWGIYLRMIFSLCMKSAPMKRMWYIPTGKKVRSS